MSDFKGSIYRLAGVAAVVLAGLGTAAPSAFAASKACEGVEVQMTKQRKQAYAPLVASAMESKIKPSQITFNAIMESGKWSAVYASTPVSDDGVMFFETVSGKKRFREVWGGWAEPSERPELIAWAKKLGAPADLAKCFAWTVTEG